MVSMEYAVVPCHISSLLMTCVLPLQMMPVGQPQVTVLTQQQPQPMQMIQPVAMAQSPPAYQRTFVNYTCYNDDNQYYTATNFFLTIF